jgi:hypothetical protein
VLQCPLLLSVLLMSSLWNLLSHATGFYFSGFVSMVSIMRHGSSLIKRFLAWFDTMGGSVSSFLPAGILTAGRLTTRRQEPGKSRGLHPDFSFDCV